MASIAWTGYVSSSSGVATNGGSSATVKQTGTSWTASSTTVTSTNGTIGGAGVAAGDLVYLTSGTGGYSTTWFRITSVTDSSHVVVHAAPGASGTTWNVGGPLTWAQMCICAGQMAAAGYQETWYVKADATYTRTTTTDAFTNAGVANAPIRIIGYKTNIGDGYLGRAANYGSLITTNMPYILYTTGSFTPTKAWLILENLNVQTAATAAGAITTAGTSTVVHCVLTNTYSGASAGALVITTSDRAINCDIFATGNVSYHGLRMNGQYGFAYGCVIKSPGGYGVLIASNIVGATISDCIITGATYGIYFANYTDSVVAVNNTISSCSSAAFVQFSGGLSTQNPLFVNNIITDCNIAWHSLYAATNPDALIRYNNRTRNITTLETANAFLNWPTYLGTTTDYGSDFNIGNFTLKMTSPSLGNAVPSGDYGAIGNNTRYINWETH